MLKDLLFALELGLRIIGTFVGCVVLGYLLDGYFHTKLIITLVMIVIAFIANMIYLLGVGKK